MNTYEVDYTDTFGGEANYSWLKRKTVTMPELTHYGYTGSVDGSYAKANRVYERELVRRVSRLSEFHWCKRHATVARRERRAERSRLLAHAPATRRGILG